MAVFTTRISHSGNSALHIQGFSDLLQSKDMTKLLEEAIEQLRDLPEDEQDAAADVLFVYIASDAREYQLRPHQVAEVHRIRRGL